MFLDGGLCGRSAPPGLRLARCWFAAARGAPVAPGSIANAPYVDLCGVEQQLTGGETWRLSIYLSGGQRNQAPLDCSLDCFVSRRAVWSGS
jgi:hypothetical protein